jgi:cell division protein ZapA (FtsZ GTPase activity inhibitor)
METALEYPSTMVITPTGDTTIPMPLRRYRPRLARASEIRSLRQLPELTVVWTKGIDALLSHRMFLRMLAERLTATPEPSKIVFLFETKSRKTSEREAAQKLVELFGYFTRPFDLEVAQGIQASEDAFNEAVAKIVATRQRAGERTDGPDHLRQLKKVIEATEDLRAKSGKLSATNVASVFGLSVAELASLVGRTRQTASKTPDADSLQPLLQPFERVARVRAVLSQSDFRKWLHLANEELDGRTPFELIRQGKVAAVAELVEDMLTGRPS